MIITLIGGAIAGREAMGFGDVKLMAGLGLIFGVRPVGMLAVTSFLVCAVLGIIFFIVIKKQKTNQYIPFGPFIVIAAFITIFVPNDTLWNLLITIFSLGTNKIV